MRFYVQLPTLLIERLKDQAQKAHRPPRHHAEWIITRALQESSDPQDDSCDERTQSAVAVSTEAVNA